MKNLAIVLAASLMLSVFAGCVGTDSGEREQSSSKSDEAKDIENDLTKVRAGASSGDSARSSPGNGTSLILAPPEKERKITGEISISESAYALVPVLAPLFKRGLVINIKDGGGSNESNSTAISMEEIAYLSSKIATSFWNCSEIAIVVDGYENAILASPLASLMDAPLIYDGNYAASAVEKLGCTETICLGNVSVEGRKMSMEEFLECEINAKPPTYVIMANPGDGEALEPYYQQSGKTPYTPHLSCLAPLFAAHYDGIIVPVTTNPAEADKSVLDACNQIKARECLPQYLLIVGDAVSVTPVYYWFETMTVNGGTWWFCTPTDNVYADLDGQADFAHEQGKPIDEKVLEPELCAGRLVASTLKEGLNYAYRIFDYDKSLSGWEKNALIWSGLAAETGEAHKALVHVVWATGTFSVKDDTVQAHTFNSTALVSDMENSNFVAAVADHGAPQGNTVQAGDLKSAKLPPNVVFPVSCLMGQIDNHESDWGVSKKDSFTYAVLQKGCAAYIAPTRPTVCGLLLMQGEGLVLAHEDAGVLCINFYENLINSDSTVGEALRVAKVSVHPYINMQYTLYGDPAFNPYEPCNEGTK